MKPFFQIMVLAPALGFLANASAFADPAPSSFNEPATPSQSEPDNTEVMVVGIIKIYDEALEKSPNDEKLRLRYIQFLKNVKEWDKAAFQTRKILASKPTDPQYQKLLNELNGEIEKVEATKSGVKKSNR